MNASVKPPSTPEASRLLAIAASAESADGQPPFSDQSLIELRTGARRALILDGVAAAIVAQAEAEFVVSPEARGRGHGTKLLEAIIAQARDELLVWAHGDHPAARALAHSHGLDPVRELLQLRAPVPAEPQPFERLDHFRSGVDDEAWLTLNAAAFAHHPEQGRVTQSALDELTTESWFAEDDFLVLRDGDTMIGYCWLKVEGGLGEFYVVGVDPKRQGEGLGRRLVTAGMTRLADRGIHEASLYVEADNVAAVRLYRSVGFSDHSVDIQYRLRHG